MKRALHRLILRLAMVLASALAGQGAAFAADCPSMLTNPLTDICWRCVLPLSIGSVEIGNIDGQRDLSNPPSPLCVCDGTPPKVGLSIGFWEPIFITEVVRKPYCFPSLGGLSLPDSIPATRHGRRTRDGGEAPDAFYQVHKYIYPIFYLLSVLADHPCLEQRAWDIAYLTEVDPTWDNAALSALVNPEALLFANPIAQAACAVDCVAATVSLPRRELFWCAGCQGGMYPNNGWTTHHVGGMVDTSLLLTQRLMYKMHRQFIAWRFHGAAALCGPRMLPIMDKRAYRVQMLAPRPVTGSQPGGCCPPMGASSLNWRAGREFPIKGEDAVYMVFRKRNCCLSPY